MHTFIKFTYELRNSKFSMVVTNDQSTIGCATLITHHVLLLHCYHLTQARICQIFHLLFAGPLSHLYEGRHHYQLNSKDYNIQIIQNQVNLKYLYVVSFYFSFSLVSAMRIMATYMITQRMIRGGSSTGREVMFQGIIYQISYRDYNKAGIIIKEKRGGRFTLLQETKPSIIQVAYRTFNIEWKPT